MAKLSIPKLMETYNEADAAGYRKGLRALRGLSNEDMYATVHNLIKYENKRIRSMIDKGYVTPAILQYARGSGRYNAAEAQTIKREQGDEAYLEYMRKAATIYTPESIKEDREWMNFLLKKGIEFKESKTSTISGEKKARKKTKATIKERYGIDMKNWSAKKQSEFWATIHELVDEGGQFAGEWYLGSGKVLERINAVYTNSPKSMIDALITYADAREDLSEEGLANASTAFQERERPADFSSLIPASQGGTGPENETAMVNGFARFRKSQNLEWK